MQILKTNRTYIPYIYLAVGLLALGGLGYLGFLAFVRNILMPGEFATYGLIITTVGAGTVSFFSPCSFTVLPSYIAFASSGQDAEPDKRFGNALKNGVAAALGVVTTVALYIEERASPQQREALEKILSGEMGAPIERWRPLIANFLRTKYLPI